MLQRIDHIDRKVSSYVHTMISHHFLLDCLILAFGKLFNRGGIVIALVLSGLFAYYVPGTPLPIISKDNIHYNEVGVYILTQIMAIITLLVVTQSFKYLIKRKRPHHGEGCPLRHFDLAVHEVGTWAMPSGDTAQGALWFTMTQLFFFGQMQIPIVLIVGTVLVGFSRVYFRCHWIGDVIIGAAAGIVEGFIFHRQYLRIGTFLTESLPEVFINF